MLVCTLEQDKHNTYSNQQDINSMNYVFGNHSTDKEIFPIMVEEMQMKSTKTSLSMLS